MRKINVEPPSINLETATKRQTVTKQNVAQQKQAEIARRMAKLLELQLPENLNHLGQTGEDLYRLAKYSMLNALNLN